MDNRLKEAGAAYRAAKDEDDASKAASAEAKRRRTEARRALQDARAPLAEEIVKAARSGARQKDIIDTIGGVYTREHIRRICRAHGVEVDE